MCIRLLTINSCEDCAASETQIDGIAPCPNVSERPGDCAGGITDQENHTKFLCFKCRCRREEATRNNH